MYKKYSDGTLLSLPKKELLLHLRAAEHNRDVAEQTLEQQAKNMKDWQPVRHGHWIEQIPGDRYCWAPWRCSECKLPSGKHQTSYCPNCGAKMDGENNDDRV